jgi:glyoxylase-like metal-dependent hydrolase (beta-lactamase superfamily II)
MATVKSLTPQPIKYVFNTHQHSDHAGGNVKMLAVADVIAHRNVRANMAKLGTAGMPRRDLFGRDERASRGKEVRARYHGRGPHQRRRVHLFSEVNAVHTGDMFLTSTSTLQPYIDYANGGTALEWPRDAGQRVEDGLRRRDSGAWPLSNRAGMMRWQSHVQDHARPRGRDGERRAAARMRSRRCS